MVGNPCHAMGKEHHSFFKRTLVAYVTLFSMCQTEATPSYAWTDNVKEGKSGNALDRNILDEYWLGGGTPRYGHGGLDGFLLNYDAMGRRIGAYVYGNEEDNEILGLKVDGVEDLRIVGRTVIGGKDHFLITQLDPEDGSGWQRAFGKDGNQQAQAVDTLPNGVSVSVGWTNSTGGGRWVGDVGHQGECCGGGYI